MIKVLYQRILQELIEAEAAAHIGAELGEHAETRTQGVSTRNMDDLVKALGSGARISKNEVSGICGDLDAEQCLFRTHPWTTPASPTSTSTRRTARPG
ncbi:transposase [Streptomyces globisporus]|uniref:transposase n=1 Tax=Streptomyces globisporus TaxID=1908 RepID=UPI00378901D2